jgi:non-ribosomal peptide synthetase component F
MKDPSNQNRFQVTITTIFSNRLQEDSSWQPIRGKQTDGVSREVSGYEKPVFSFLEESATKYPNQVYTIFNDGTRTFAQVNDVANRVANFLISRGIKKGDRVAIF